MMRRLLILSAGAALFATGCAESGEAGTTDDPVAETDGNADGTADGVDDTTDSATDDPTDDGTDDPVELTFQPLAWVFESNPIDTPDPIEVELLHLTSEDHTLQGDFANVRNCLPDEENGQPVEVNVGLPLTLTTCTPTHVAVPGDDMTYRHIKPPEDHGSGTDSTAELMMYHHMQLIHDYFQQGHGLTDLDHPLDALVNIQAFVDAAPFCQEWTSLGNAAFMPEGAIGQFGVDLSMGIEGDAIVFGQTTSKDFSYDADVIYHEYTHAMIGSTRLNAVYPDKLGLNNLPGALNEGYADYFAGTLSDNSVVGNYALNDIEPQTICGFPLGQGGANMARDMETERTCEDLTAEVHADGEIFASALWAIRKALGAEKADAVILGALVGFTHTTDFQLASAATIERAKTDLDAADAAVVEQIFTDRGITDCDRVVPVTSVGKRGIPLRFEGVGSTFTPFPGFMPGYLQFKVELPENVTAVRIFVYAQGGNNKMQAVWKPGDQPIKYTNGIHDGFKTTDFELDGNATYKTRLAGGCLGKGTWTFAIHNQGEGFQVTGIAAFPNTQPVEDLNFDPPCGD